MIDADFLEKARRYGETKDVLENNTNDVIQWAIRVGQARNILNNALREFAMTSDIMRELEKNIPHFHKQPGLFNQFQERVDSLTSTLQEVNRQLSYVQEPKKPVRACDCDCPDREDSDREYDEDDYE